MRTGERFASAPPAHDFRLIKRKNAVHIRTARYATAEQPHQAPGQALYSHRASELPLQGTAKPRLWRFPLLKSPAPLRYTQPEGKRQKTMNENISRKKVWLSVILIYLICFACRCIEYFCIRTDESFFGEAFLHKLAGIAVLILSARHFGYTAEALGFSKRRAGITIPAGFCLGLACYAAAYGIEIAILKSRGACGALRTARAAACSLR